jgi:protein-L-isoaspartate(D-aspartate) O-methyltransferase
METDRTGERETIVATQIAARGIRDPAVLAAMRRVPRHVFVPEADQALAYGDGPLAIGHGQTISQPFIVALMTELAQVGPSSRALEVGTGCGYQTAILARCAAEVWSVEIEPELSQTAARTIRDLGITNVRLRVGDGTQGWAEGAPYDAVVVTAAPHDVPAALVEQLALGGHLVIPVGDTSQELWVITRTPDGLQRASVIPVRFVPMR